MKKIGIFFVTIILLISIFLWSQKDNQQESKEKTVGIIQFMEHPALDAARGGFLAKLNKLGYTKENTQILFESAQGNPALCSQIAQKFVGQKVDVIVAIGTTPAQAALQNIMNAEDAQRTKLIFLSITDPVEAKLVSVVDGKISSQYAAGISDYVEPQDYLNLFKEMFPNINNVGVIYNPGEANSTTVLKNLREKAESFRIKILAVPATKTSEVILAAQNLSERVEAIFIDNDNTALAAFDSISDVCIKRKVPLFVSDVDLADKALASLGPDQKRIGEQGAQFAVLLLEKKSLPEDLGVQFADSIDLYLNQKFAEKIDVIIPQELCKKAKQIIH